MTLRTLSLRQFRNYGELHQPLSPALNVLVGANAQGKTSFLEAIYLLATSKSLRGSVDQDLIGWSYGAAIVTGEVLREKAHEVELEVHLSRKERKGLVINQSRVQRAMDFIGQLKAVAFSVGDLEVVHGEPARRRRFLDLEICQLSPSYCLALTYYRKVLEQRNRLLKLQRDRATRNAGEESLAAWTEQLVTHGSKVLERRRQFLTRLDDLARPIHARLTRDKEHLSLAYEPCFRCPETKEEIQEAFRQALGEVREEEFRRQVSLVGPHRDDLVFLINGRDARVYGSQGQQRTAALSVRLAEIALMEDLTGEPPICILDDVFSELDGERRAHLLEVAVGRCQTFLSTTDRELVPAPLLRKALVLEIEEGTAVHHA